MALLLRLWGQDVRCARSGPEALDYEPDAVLMEVGFPGMDGFEVARRMRGSEGGPPPLLVTMTGYGAERHRLQVRQAGFDLHLLKPACPEVVRELLGTSQRRENRRW